MSNTGTILEAVNAGIENVPKLITGDVTPQSLLNRYQFTLQAFGMDKVRAKIYNAGKALQPTENKNTYQPNEIADTEFAMTTNASGKALISALGTPVFCDMILMSQDGTQQLQLLWVLADVAMTRNIVKTTINGRNGTVKEYISNGDYIVTLRGAFSSTFTRTYPKAQVEQLVKLCELPEPLKVVSEYLLLFNIHNLVVEDYSMGQIEGTPNLQRFEIKCSSDEPLILRKKQNV
ncbi:DUF6046 domain-containing protein [Limnovirga soli]|uniref:DUF6046 domain-containing protein n=1 Tax=Limnovirga soli TaxID=2656915 RepID=A0A8J8FAK3_9BACT|nr:DUF6046 domain-containing protein [Limnovirga soli]NNV54525.1 hypothetical protein [Limnovirga soli]